MSVLDSPNNVLTIQTLNPALNDSTVVPGRGVLLAHTNGVLYSVWAKNSALERRLYFASSTDNGQSWETPIELTSGKWDDDPVLLQLDPTDDSSEIGLVFNRANSYLGSSDYYLQRCILDTSGSLTGAIAQVGTSLINQRGLSLFRDDTNYYIFAVTSDNNEIKKYVNAITANPHTGFLTNGWAKTDITNPFPKAAFNLRVQKLSSTNSGHWMMTAIVLSASDPSSFTGIDQLGGIYTATARYNLYAAFSDDNGSNWTTQQLTTYSTAPTIDLTGQKSALDTTVIELANGTIAVVYQEAYGLQIVSKSTTPGIGTNSTTLTNALYHATHNCLIFGVSHTIDGGVFVVELSTGTLHRFFATGIDNYLIWSNLINYVALSPNEQYLAIAASDGQGSIDIFDTTDSNPANWARQKEILQSGGPPTLVADSPLWCEFYDNDKLLFTYSTTTGSANHIGEIYSISGDTLTPLNTTGGLQSIPVKVDYRIDTTNGRLIFAYDGMIRATTISTGAHAYSTDVSGVNGRLIYDDINSQYIVGSDTAFFAKFFTDAGAFTLDTTWPTSGYPAIWACGATFPGAGAIFFSTETWSYYSFTNGTFGPITNPNEQFPWLGYGESGNPPLFATLAKSNTWLLISTAHYLQAIPIKRVSADTATGRLRWGVFPYVTGTKQLTLGNFYDLCDITKISGDDFYNLTFPRGVLLQDDTLAFYLWEDNMLKTTNQLSVQIGLVSPMKHTLAMKAAIRNSGSKTITFRARVRKTIEQTLQIRAFLARAQCFQMYAKITPIATVTLAMKAAIKNWTSATALITYRVGQESVFSTQVTYNIDVGWTRIDNMQMYARIEKLYETRVGVQYVIPTTLPGSGVITYTFTASDSGMASLSMRARITHETV